MFQKQHDHHNFWKLKIFQETSNIVIPLYVNYFITAPTTNFPHCKSPSRSDLPQVSKKRRPRYLHSQTKYHYLLFLLRRIHRDFEKNTFLRIIVSLSDPWMKDILLSWRNHLKSSWSK